MSSEWTTVKLSDVAKIVGGGTPSTSESNYWDGSIPWITPKDLSSHKGLYIASGSRSITDAGLKNSSAKLVPKDAVLFTSRAPIGYVAIAAQSVCTSQGFKSLVLNEGNDSRYFYYLLKHHTPEIEARATGSTFKEISGAALGSFEVSMPPAYSQKIISDALGALDERINLLHETNQTLEAIAQALFKSWFVDFDPVHAKIQGRAPEGMDEDTARLFPNALEESELGLVPRGWRVESVQDLCSMITNGGTPSRSKPVFWDGGSIPWFKTGEFHDGFLLKPSEFITSDALNGSSVKLLPKDAVLMAIYAAPTVGRLGILTEPATFNQACTGMVAKADIGPWFVFWTLFHGRDWFNSRANGAAQQNISKATVAAYRFVAPDKQVLESFNTVASSLHDAIRLNSEKVQTLVSLRDTLLPRLVSGQLRLSKVADQVEEALS
jgi:type I restriction enzyme S subunit